VQAVPPFLVGLGPLALPLIDATHNPIAEPVRQPNVSGHCPSAHFLRLRKVVLGGTPLGGGGLLRRRRVRARVEVPSTRRAVALVHVAEHFGHAALPRVAASGFPASRALLADPLALGSPPSSSTTKYLMFQRGRRIPSGLVPLHSPSPARISQLRRSGFGATGRLRPIIENGEPYVRTRLSWCVMSVAVPLNSRSHSVSVVGACRRTCARPTGQGG